MQPWQRQGRLDKGQPTFLLGGIIWTLEGETAQKWMRNCTCCQSEIHTHLSNSEEVGGTATLHRRWTDGWMDHMDHMDNLGAMSDWTLELNRRRWNPKAFFTPIHLCRQQFALLLCTATAEVNRFAVSRSWWNTHKEHLVCPQNSYHLVSLFLFDLLAKIMQTFLHFEHWYAELIRHKLWINNNLFLTKN